MNLLTRNSPYYQRLRWSRGSVLAFGTQVRGFKPGRSRWIFRAKKSSARLPSEGNFSPIVPPSAAKFAGVASEAGDLLWWKLERSKSLVLFQVRGLTCRWQRHSVKPSCWESSTTVAQAKTQLGFSADWRRRRKVHITTSLNIYYSSWNTLYIYTHLYETELWDWYISLYLRNNRFESCLGCLHDKCNVDGFWHFTMHRSGLSSSKPVMQTI
jgi:hypothetical protein